MCVCCCEDTHVNVDRLDGVDMDVWGRGGAIPLAKLIAVVLLPWAEILWDGNGLGRGDAGVAQGPESEREKRRERKEKEKKRRERRKEEREK